MIPDLPREFLWTELNSMDEFFKLDPVNEDFFETFVKLREEPFGGWLDAVQVFNEVYYQATKILFEHPADYDFLKYVSDIKANLGWSYSVDLALSMVYWLTEIAQEKMYETIKIQIRNFLIGKNCWESFSQCYERLSQLGERLNYDFKPRPVSPDIIRKNYISWANVTYSYDLDAIRRTINLWDKVRDRRKIAAIIKERLDNGRKNKKDNTVVREAIDLLDYYIGERKVKPSSNNEEVLQGRISELEAEVERLNTLMEEKKQSGKDRKFTLVQMVDYCKGCVDWNDVKSIVAMLNKLLRRIGTDEDSELVDSIEAEFINRKYGDTVMGDKNEFNDNSGLNRITLPKGVSAQEALRLLQNKKKEDGEEG